MKRRNRILVAAPASSANLGCGFDVFAVALRKPKDRLTLQRAQSGVSITVKGPERLPEKPKENVAGAVASAMMADYDVRGGISMTLEKGVPVGSGLGSSAASSVAAAVGTNALFRLGISKRDLIKYAGIGERVASGTAHYDNVAASLAGGFVVVGRDNDYVRMEPPASLALCLVTPVVDLPKEKTRFARSLLPAEVPLQKMVDVTRAASLMVHGFAVGSIEEIGAAMTVSLVDERRAPMIPGLEEVRRAAMSEGAAGLCISGAGPAVLAVCLRRSSDRVLGGMVRAFRLVGVESSGFVTGVGRGCVVIER
ncbi:MAG: homoserine kinase [Nitrososphaerales archaeon]|nr:homoserine kinase [Nitrososphaerales archaeon]